MTHNHAASPGLTAIRTLNTDEIEQVSGGTIGWISAPSISPFQDFDPYYATIRENRAVSQILHSDEAGHAYIGSDVV